jgi:uronate dehydrogenase
MSSPRTVLLTGAAGVIGRSLTGPLAQRHRLVGLDLRDGDVSFPGRFVVGDCADPSVASGAVAGVDAVVHLAGIPTEADLPSILHSHVETTAALLDAMVEHGVRRMVYASSNHAVGMTPRPVAADGPVRIDTPFRPDTFYGVGKVAAEALLRLYADRHDIDSVALRIGSFQVRPESRRQLSTWLSPDDCARLVLAALETDAAGARVVYGISANRAAWWDLEPGKAIGYQPRDDASTFENDIESRAADADEASRVGGPYALPGFARRPFDV